jgi:uncharacterized membrane protein YphA (DoxX/SURF4 family)
MKQHLKQLPFFAPIVLRLGLSGVFVWFGTSQIVDATAWTSYIPGFVAHITGLSLITLVTCNGIFEICMALLLIFGFWVRPVAAVLFLHMCAIVASVGLDSIGVRDVAIATALLSVTLYGNDIISWHYVQPVPPESLAEGAGIK